MPRRYDNSTLGKARRTPSGALIAPLYITRVGVFSYRRQDGTVQREYRPQEEVFREDSLNSLRGATVTHLHPKELVDPTNWRQVSIGHIADKVTPDGKRVDSEVYISDAEAIKKVGTEIAEASAGYSMRLDRTPGVHPEFGPYDVVQRDIEYNHVALGPKNWGRAGPDIALRLDADDAVIQVEHQTRPERPEETEVDKRIIRIDGRDYEYGSEEHINKIEADFRLREQAWEAEKKELQSRADSAEASKLLAEKALKEATDPATMTARVQERTGLLASAKAYLGDEVLQKMSKRGDSLDQMPDIDVYKLVIRKDDEDFDLNRSEELLGAYARGLMKSAGASSPAVRKDANQEFLKSVLSSKGKEKKEEEEKKSAYQQHRARQAARGVAPLRATNRK